VDEIKVNKPAFVLIIPTDTPDHHHIAISSFNGIPLSPDHVYFIANYSIKREIKLETLSNKGLHWPNQPSYAAESILGSKTDPFGGILQPSGFLVPTKTDGSIIYYPFETSDRSGIKAGDPIDLIDRSQQKNTWFYHRAKVVDMNADGHLDVLTCRTHKPSLGKTLVELIALIFDPNTGVFNETLILPDVCDIFFDIADIDNDGRFEIVASGFFISKMFIIYSDDSKNSFTTGQNRVIQIDGSNEQLNGNGGKFFDIQIVDLDSSGNLELLVTNHQGTSDAIKGCLFFYSMQGNNIRNGTWLRNTIYSNFPVILSGLNQAAPGSAIAFSPMLNQTQSSGHRRKHIVVSGDGASSLYLFEPDYTSDFGYSLVWSQLYTGFTVGGMAIADLDQDGINEFIVAIYEANKCDVFTMEKV
jgi:hypothetical protein